MNRRPAISGLSADQSHPSSISRRQIYVILAILAIQLILVSPSLMPGFAQINAFDEAKYIISGRQLLQLEVRDLAWGPLVAVPYALLHMILGRSPDWFMLEAWAGRFVLFTFLWLTTMALGRELRPHLNPFVLAGILFVNVPFFAVVANQSDALFAGFAALALSRLIVFRRDLRSSSLAWGSLFVGLAVLCRAEAVLLLVLYPLLAFVIGCRRVASSRLIAAILLPELAMLVIYLIAFRLSTGSFNLGFQGKAYDSFVTNQSVTTGGNVSAGKAEARRLFGTAQENEGSVFRAIARNPGAFALRLWASVKTLPDYYLTFFQKQLGPVVLVLALWGIVQLLLERRLHLIALLGVWALVPLSSIAFLPRHLVPQVTYMILVLGAVGLEAMIEVRSGRLHLIQLASWAGLALFGWLDAKPALMVSGLTVLLAIALADLAYSPTWSHSTRSASLGFLLLASGLILRTHYRFPNYESLGTSSEELGIHFLESHVPADSLVLSPFPGPAIAARMSDIGPGDVPAAARSPDTFLAWMQRKGIEAIYLDQRFKESVEVYNLIDGMAGTQLEVGFASEDGRIRILLPPD